MLLICRLLASVLHFPFSSALFFSSFGGHGEAHLVIDSFMVLIELAMNVSWSTEFELQSTEEEEFALVCCCCCFCCWPDEASWSEEQYRTLSWREQHQQLYLNDAHISSMATIFYDHNHYDYHHHSKVCISLPVCARRAGNVNWNRFFFPLQDWLTDKVEAIACSAARSRRMCFVCSVLIGAFLLFFTFLLLLLCCVLKSVLQE